MKELTGDILSPVEGAEIVVCYPVACKAEAPDSLTRRIWDTCPEAAESLGEMLSSCPRPEALIGGYDVSLVGFGEVMVAAVLCLDEKGRLSYGHLDMALARLAWQFPGATFRFPRGFGCRETSEWDYVRRIIEEQIPEAEIWRDR